MSSSGINAINSGPLTIRTYLNSSINNTYVVGNYEVPLSNNYVLITSTNGLLVPSNTIYVSSISSSHGAFDEIVVSSLYANFTSSLVGNIGELAVGTLHCGAANISSLFAVSGSITNLTVSTLVASSISTGTITADYISTLEHLTFLDGNNSTLVVDSIGSDLYVNGFPILTEGNISSISSLYWEDDLGSGTLNGGIFNKNLGQGSEKYMVGIGAGADLNGTLSIKYSGGNYTGNSLFISSNNNYVYTKNSWDGANNGLSLHLEENQPTCCGPTVYLTKSYGFGASQAGGDLGMIKFLGTNPSNTAVVGAEIYAQQTGVPSTFTPTDIVFSNCTAAVQNYNMIITGDGRVGVGTMTPSQTLDVNGSVNIAQSLSVYGSSIYFEPNDPGYFDAFKIELNGANYLTYKSTVNGGAATFVQNSGGGQLVLATNNPVVFVNGTGGGNNNIGIGINAPQYALDVNGAIQANNLGRFRLGTDVVQEGFAASWNTIQAGGTNGMTELISGRGTGPNGGFDFFVGVADGMAAAAGDFAMRIDGATKRIGIGTTAPQYALHVVGDIYASGNITAGSDVRFKTNISTLSNSLSTVKNMRGVVYNLKGLSEDGEVGPKRVGVIAQEIEKVLPEVVSTDKSGAEYKSVAYGNIVGVLIEAIKELSDKIDNLEKRLS